MKIEHVAIWVKNLDVMKFFYEKYFNASSSGRYTNNHKHFSSYFLSFAGGARLEIMQRPDIVEAPGKGTSFGYVHLAISVGTAFAVDELTEKLRSDGYTVVGNPRTTGDGYYESVIADPEGNLIEITV